MTIFDEIPADEKLDALNMYKKNTLADIFRLCVFLGIDTETFDPSTYRAESDMPMGDSYMLKEMCKKYININNKLSSL
jgi:hypothetical protein